MSFILLVLMSSTETPRLPGPCTQTDGCQASITITSRPVDSCTTTVTVRLAGVRCHHLFYSLLPCLSCLLSTHQTDPLYAPCTCILVPLYDRWYASYRHAPRIAVPRGTSGVEGPRHRPPSQTCLLSRTRRRSLFLKRRSDLSLPECQESLRRTTHGQVKRWRHHRVVRGWLGSLDVLSADPDRPTTHADWFCHTNRHFIL